MKIWHSLHLLFYESVLNSLLVVIVIVVLQKLNYVQAFKLLNKLRISIIEQKEPLFSILGLAWGERWFVVFIFFTLLFLELMLHIFLYLLKPFEFRYLLLSEVFLRQVTFQLCLKIIKREHFLRTKISLLFFIFDLFSPLNNF